MGRRRICTTNDREALAEELAAAKWERHRDREIDPDAWEDAPPYWQIIMRDFPEATIKMLDHG